MEQETTPFQLTLALLRTELSVNAMVMALDKAGFVSEHNVYDLSMQVMELIGFTAEDREKDEVLEFYVRTLDCLTEQQLQPTPPNINDTVLQFYTDLLAEKKTRLARV